MEKLYKIITQLKLWKLFLGSLLPSLLISILFSLIMTTTVYWVNSLFFSGLLSSLIITFIYLTRKNSTMGGKPVTEEWLFKQGFIVKFGSVSHNHSFIKNGFIIQNPLRGNSVYYKDHEIKTREKLKKLYKFHQKHQKGQLLWINLEFLGKKKRNSKKS